ncbi:hypothetical protein METBIDRAFT_188432 [Metschnikowia bicuspidata var. bicuspidata NRRL YB-4993]|uniref:Uncharacterized protein n=1 Tax=Metschnikowia bicuspidata var. bicuspidata NRRL YB-4993 TaxID=869754 RepID=A0A1A0HCF2_9ASCO|nr:hypothetical protein METBIDRAFT_188432 [Metschnikowia bicuspidata var. bicuspidata NRRL YB-4993]OBA21588.1 hypothetical protein METBIDRAFT_188432 [Metschnikowia bicuspidata var. bicuspidata NRRL YB-4993]
MPQPKRFLLWTCLIWRHEQTPKSAPSPNSYVSCGPAFLVFHSGSRCAGASGYVPPAGNRASKPGSKICEKRLQMAPVSSVWPSLYHLLFPMYDSLFLK